MPDATGSDGHAGHRFTRHRVTRIVALGALAVVLLGIGAAAAVYVRLDGNISGVDIDGLLGRDRPEDQPHDSLDILVLGSDSREGGNADADTDEDADEDAGDADGAGDRDDADGSDEDAARADTAMVVHLNAERDAATIVSLPRDTLVDRPECSDPDDGTTVPPEQDVIFNEAFSVGGPACAVKTVETMTGIRMDHYLEVDFEGFQELVDTLGGVEITLTEPIRDPDSHLDLSAGTHRLDGSDALALVRTRKTVGDGSDLGRIQLQHAFLNALAEEVRGVGLLDDPQQVYRLADTATSTVTTDRGLASVGRLTDLARDLDGIGPEDLQLVTLPVRYDEDDPNRVVPREEAGQVWDALRADRAVPESLLRLDPEPVPGATETPDDPPVRESTG